MVNDIFTLASLIGRIEQAFSKPVKVFLLVKFMSSSYVVVRTMGGSISSRLIRTLPFSVVARYYLRMTALVKPNTNSETGLNGR